MNKKVVLKFKDEAAGKTHCRIHRVETKALLVEVCRLVLKKSTSPSPLHFFTLRVPFIGVLDLVGTKLITFVDPCQFN